MTEDYVSLLNRALSQLPPKTEKSGRFETPKSKSTISGSRTVLNNMREISNRLNRDENHLLKFLSRELATAGNIDGAQAVFQGNFDNRVFQKLLDRYMEEYVFCAVCRQPDTKIIKKGRYNYLTCEACGATSSIR